MSIYKNEQQAEQDGCTHDCSSCGEDCSSRTQEDFLEPCNAYSNIKKIIGIVSGKGGVGKSFVTSYLATLMQRRGFRTAILDADLTGPSIPQSFGIHGNALSRPEGIVPFESENGIKMMSVNLLLQTEDTPVIWRGPVLAGMVKHFFSDVFWGEVDYLFVDMPPGTGDVPLTVFQSIPLDGVLIVTSPQELVSMIVSKAVNMANAMDIPVIGLIENFSFLECGKCGERISVFGKSNVEGVSSKFSLPILAKLPINPKVAEAVDAGKIEGLSYEHLDEAAEYLVRTFRLE